MDSTLSMALMRSGISGPAKESESSQNRNENKWFSFCEPSNQKMLFPHAKLDTGRPVCLVCTSSNSSLNTTNPRPVNDCCSVKPNSLGIVRDECMRKPIQKP